MAKYSPISEFLVDQTADRIRLDFTAVERLLGVSLPRSADEYQAWWANDASHSQAKAWLDAGWRTENLDLSRRTVEFVRVRQKKQGLPSDPWGALGGTVTVRDETALVTPTGERWEAEAGKS
ncbi:MAG: DUF7662 domain-containing protein [Phreatobacter sp.]|jgi:hypothetical protein|uniref:DUF7662 domain-containing protein n=1 Tax=Phreatobacter sp. TaxID=1966341 RepID=UPI004038477F